MPPKLDNFYHLIFTLRGVPLTCLITMLLSGEPVSTTWLEAKTGYSRNTIAGAIRHLSSQKYIERNPRGWGWMVKLTPQLQQWLQSIADSSFENGIRAEIAQNSPAAPPKRKSRAKIVQNSENEPSYEIQNRAKTVHNSELEPPSETQNRANIEQISPAATPKRKNRAIIARNSELEPPFETQNRANIEQISPADTPKRKSRAKIARNLDVDLTSDRQNRAEIAQISTTTVPAKRKSRAKIARSLRESSKKDRYLKNKSIYLDSPVDHENQFERDIVTDEFSGLKWPRLLAATDELFGESVLIPENADPDIRTFLALVAEAWQSRQRLNYPARIIHINLRRGHKPASRYYKNPLTYLPGSFLTYIGIRRETFTDDPITPEPVRPQEGDDSIPQEDGDGAPGSSGLPPGKTFDDPRDHSIDESLLQPIVPGSRWTAISAWQATKALMREELSKRMFDDYLAHAFPEEFAPQESTLTLSVPDVETSMWIESRLGRILAKKFRYVSGCEVNLEFIVKDPPNAGNGLLAG